MYINFGKHKGCHVSELSEPYLKWLYTTDIDMSNNHPNVSFSFQTNLEELKNYINANEAGSFTLGFGKYRDKSFDEVITDKKIC